MENPIVLQVNCDNDFMIVRPESLLIDLSPALTKLIMALHKVVLDNGLNAVEASFSEGRWSLVELGDQYGELIDNALDLILYEPACDVASASLVVRKLSFYFQAIMAVSRTTLILKSDSIAISSLETLDEKNRRNLLSYSR